MRNDTPSCDIIIMVIDDRNMDRSGQDKAYPTATAAARSVNNKDQLDTKTQSSKNIVIEEST